VGYRVDSHPKLENKRMATAFTAPGSSTRSPGRDRLFFGGVTIVMLVTVIGGFGPTYYFTSVLNGRVALTPALHVHGAVFTAWMLLLVVQSSLISAGRADLHRQLGIAGAILGACMTFLGGYVAITRFRGGLMAAPPEVSVAILLAIALATVVVFPALFGSALLMHRRTDYHKRLVILATTELLTAAVARLPGVAEYGPVGFFGATDMFVLALAAYDFGTHGRIHPATLWGGLFLIVSQPLRLIIGASAPWAEFATWLAG
jgi:hypothetical protein